MSRLFLHACAALLCPQALGAPSVSLLQFVSTKSDNSTLTAVLASLVFNDASDEASHVTFSAAEKSVEGSAPWQLRWSSRDW